VKIRRVKDFFLILSMKWFVILTIVLIAGCTQTTTPANQICEDSDGGVNYYVQGFVNPCPCYEEPCPSCGVWIETCLNESTLIEYSCENLGGELYTCPNGCKDGACLNETVCKGSARCFNGTITEIVDGDSLEVNNVSDNITIRLALVSCPEYYENGYEEAKDFTSSICPIGSTAMIDEDDGQIEGSYGRLVAVVYCDNRNLNEELLVSGHGEIDKYYCNKSEFGNERWAKEYGC